MSQCKKTVVESGADGSCCSPSVRILTEICNLSARGGRNRVQSSQLLLRDMLAQLRVHTHMQSWV